MSIVRLFIALITMVSLVGCTLQQTATQSAENAPTATRRAQSSVAPTVAVQRIAGFEAVSLRDLPPEATDTMQLILADGPFPYRQDGSVFQNRERILPRKSEGYYHEYTIETPGSDDRGARRFVVGQQGEVFYTEDHYDSFVQVIP